MKAAAQKCKTFFFRPASSTQVMLDIDTMYTDSDVCGGHDRLKDVMQLAKKEEGISTFK